MEIVPEETSVERSSTRISVLLRDDTDFKWKEIELEDFRWDDWQGVETITLGEVYNQCEEMFGWIGIEVVFELGLKGWIYRYDRNVYDWVVHGETRGYA